jgi:transposase-like protein
MIARNPFKSPISWGVDCHLRASTMFPWEHVSELLAERGVAADRSCIWRWVQAYPPELNKRCRPHLKPTNKSCSFPFPNP